MNRDAQDNLVLLVGATMLTVGVTDLHLRYVKPQMQPLIVLSGLVLLGLGLRGLRRMTGEIAAARRGADRPAHDQDAHGHEHDHAMTRTAWLMALPLLVLTLIAPPSLGAYAAARSDTTVAEPTEDLPPLPAATGGARTLTLTDYYVRVLYGPQSLQGERIRLSGFVVPVEGRWYVARMSLACCAADGRPVKVLVSGDAAGPVPPADAWVEVVGRYTAPQVPPGNELAVATLEVESVQRTARPANPYE